MENKQTYLKAHLLTTFVHYGERSYLSYTDGQKSLSVIDVDVFLNVCALFFPIKILKGLTKTTMMKYLRPERKTRCATIYDGKVSKSNNSYVHVQRENIQMMLRSGT